MIANVNGPGSTNNNNVSVSLSGAGIPSLNYSFSVGNLYNTKDLSSKSSKYGRWQFVRISNPLNPIYTNNLTTRPGIRVTNTQGNLALQLSHSLDFYSVQNNTGVITITTPDR